MAMAVPTEERLERVRGLYQHHVDGASRWLSKAEAHGRGYASDQAQAAAAIASAHSRLAAVFAKEVEVLEALVWGTGGS